jgi:hypothetical protein
MAVTYEKMAALIHEGKTEEVSSEIRKMAPIDAALTGMNLCERIEDNNTRTVFYRALYNTGV